MSLSIALSAAILFPPAFPFASPQRGASPPAVVDDSGSAWVVIHAGAPWVCWSVAPDCWRRVEIDAGNRDTPTDVLDDDDLLDVAPVDLVDRVDDGPASGTSQQWRFGFAHGSGGLWIELDDRRWRLARGQQHARPLDADELAPVRLSRPQPRSCTRTGQRPAIVGGRVGWMAAPSCEPPPPSVSCVRSVEGPRPRRPVPVRLRAGIELGVVRGWTASDEDPDSGPVTRFVPRAGVELMFVVELGFDPSGMAQAARSRATLLERPRIRQLPTVPEGPLALAEHRAHAAVLCGGGS